MSGGVGAPWPAALVELWALERLKPRPGNPRIHSEAQVEQIAASINEWGWTNPVLVDEEGLLIAGHGRLLAAQRLALEEIPVMVARGWTPAQIRAYVIADNKLALNAEWDEDLLRAELRALDAEDFALGLIGFDDTELAQLDLFGAGVGVGVSSGKPDEDPGEPPKDPVTRPGELWLLGKHRILCGDSRNPAELAVLMNAEKARLVHADPPYGMGKEAEGVQNDNIYGEDLDRFQMAWWVACRPFLEDNASAYIWGKAPDLWRLWWRGLAATEPLTLRNEIVWDKKSIAGMRSADLTQYPEATERCLFFQLGRHVFLINQTKDDFWPGWEPLRAQLAGERDKAGFAASDVKRICGNHMYGHWFGTSQWAFITQENYDKLAAAADGRAFTRPYVELLAEYRQLAQVFNGEIKDPRAEKFAAARPYFDNAHDIMRDVWDFPRVSGEERQGHATPKPIAMMERIAKSSSREGELILEPFGGSGSTLIGAEKVGRRCFVMEIDARYCDLTVARWQGITGQEATLERTGQTFETLKNERKKTEAELHEGAGRECEPQQQAQSG